MNELSACKQILTNSIECDSLPSNSDPVPHIPNTTTGCFIDMIYSVIFHFTMPAFINSFPPNSL